MNHVILFTKSGEALRGEAESKNLVFQSQLVEIGRRDPSTSSG